MKIRQILQYSGIFIDINHKTQTMCRNIYNKNDFLFLTLSC